MKTVYRAAATVNIEKQMCVASINKHTHTRTGKKREETARVPEDSIIRLYGYTAGLMPL